jgi:hypothetical protein
MSLFARAFELAKAAMICAVALMLLLDPFCGEFCHAQSCSASKTQTGKSACHGSNGMMAENRANGAVHAARICGLQETPAALPVSAGASSELSQVKLVRNAVYEATASGADGFIASAVCPNDRRSHWFRGPVLSPAGEAPQILRI